MAFQTGSSSDGDDYGTIAEINIIPLVDVMLVLLIISMVTTPFMEQGVNVELPVANGEGLRRDESATPVILYITADRQIRLGDKLLPRSDVVGSLKKAFAERKTKEIFVRADREVPYGFVAETIGRVRSAGVERVGLVTLPEGS
jgi:biopolymer transport protein TolR